MPPTQYVRRNGDQTINGPLPIGRLIVPGVDSVRNNTPAEIDIRANALITGLHASGTTNLMRIIIDRVLECSDTIVWAYDPDRLWRLLVQPRPAEDLSAIRTGIVDWYGITGSELRRMLTEARRVINARHCAGGLTVSREVPALVIAVNTVEFSNRQTADERNLMMMLDVIATDGPPVGVYVVRENLRVEEFVMSDREISRYGCRIALAPDSATAHRLFGAGGVSQAGDEIVDRSDRHGAGLYTDMTSAAADPFQADLFPPDLDADVARARVRFEADIYEAVSTREYATRWDRIRGWLDPTTNAAFLLRNVDESLAGGQTVEALTEALAEIRGEDEHSLALARHEVAAWISQQLNDGVICEYGRPGFYILTKHRPDEPEVFARYVLPAHADLGALVSLLHAADTTSTGAGYGRLTVGGVTFDGDGADLIVTVYAKKADLGGSDRAVAEFLRQTGK